MLPGVSAHTELCSAFRQVDPGSGCSLGPTKGPPSLELGENGLGQRDMALQRLRWYRTGDLVVDDGAGCFRFHGRRDRLVKKRGYRIELGEIESALYRHDGVDRAAVVARADESGVSIAAFVALKPDQKRSIIAMKRHCTVYLPNYMVPDTITFMSSLPATSTDKVDYQRLGAMAADQK